MDKNAEAKKIVVLAVDGLRKALSEEQQDFADEMEARKVYEAQDIIIKQLEKEHGGRRWMYECYKTEELVISEGVSRNGVPGFIATDKNTGVIVASGPSLDSLNRAIAKRQESMESAKLIGRPSEMEGGKAVKVYLDAESIAIATKLGNGNVSEGIRKALKQAEE